MSYTLCTRRTCMRRGGVQTTPTQACRFPARMLRARGGSTQEGSNLLLLASKISPAAEKRRSTAVDVAGAVKYLNMSFNATIRTIFCGYQDKPKLYLFANATRATPAGPFASKEASIFSHQARHSTSCSSENRTLSTKSSTDLVLFIPASALN